MTDDLHDLDPLEVEKILEHADDFIAADSAVEEILAWGESALKEEEQRIKVADGTIADFKSAAQRIEAEVAQKLRELEDATRQKYSASQ